MKNFYDVIIVGSGVAGLNCALNLPQDKRALIICKGLPDESDSYLAQGGICCLMDESDYNSYFNDTMAAGHGENDPAAVECMIRSSKRTIEKLIGLGVQFNRDANGNLAVTREGGHSANRICYHEDTTGKEITTRLMERVTALPNVEICPDVCMLDIISRGNCCYGIVARAAGKTSLIFADYTVFACGGIGGVFKRSTNFRLLTGDGVAIALKRGVKVKNVNYVQVHPTTLYTSATEGRCFLISESVRGEGAVLRDKNFCRFTDELQPRDVVTAAIYRKMEEDGTDFVWLDMRGIGREEILAHFPQIVAKCGEEGYDVFTECIPVVPAQHYFMGGVQSDLNGRTTMSRLYAVGETACNGVHGKNRLASNSLLESIIFAGRAAEDIAANYVPADRAEAKTAADMLDLTPYEQPEKLMEEYKRIILKAIEEANRE